MPKTGSAFPNSQDGTTGVIRLPAEDGEKNEHCVILGNSAGPVKQIVASRSVSWELLSLPELLHLLLAQGNLDATIIRLRLIILDPQDFPALPVVFLALSETLF
jgi:hypothetical protein